MLAISDDFLRGDAELSMEESWTEEAGASADLHGLTDAVRVRWDDGRRLRPEDDPWLAELLHEYLQIGRRVASDRRFWAWLAVTHFADVLRGRWSNGEKPPDRKRFAGPLPDQGLSRLWWAAEFTSDVLADAETHRRDLRRLLAGQYRTDRLLKMPVLRHTPAMLGVLDAIGDDIRWQVLNELCKRLGIMATAYAVEAMTREEVGELAAQIYADVIESGAGLVVEEAPGPH